jgi:ribokinase
MPKPSKQVVVVGSLNADIIATVDRLPKAGETLAASGLIRRFGGKGANQALAARKQGAPVTMIGCVGADADGAAYRERFEKAGIDCQHVRMISRQPTGTALIAVDAKAENLIVVAAGANGSVSPAAIRKAKPEIETCGALLAQLEVPVPAVVAAMKTANREGVPVVFNPSPFRRDFPWGGVLIDVAIVNETEAEQLFRKPASDLPKNPAKWRAAMRRRRMGALIVTRGAKPTLLLTTNDCVTIPSTKVEPIDTVGAGDAFAGVFTAHLAGGATLEDAVRYGNAAGALATLRTGAQEALPSWAATQRMAAAIRRTA